MNVRIYRKDKSVPLPKRQTPLSAGLDIYASEEIEIWPGQTALIPTGLIIESPSGFYFKIFIRSGFAVKNGVSLVNDVGIVDGDYCGPGDEVKVGMVRHYNPRDPNINKPLIIQKGSRIAQIIFEKNDIPEINWDEQQNANFAGSSRGGFGSTGSQ